MLYIDVRKADDYGIGVYIKNVVPLVARQILHSKPNCKICILSKQKQNISFLGDISKYEVRFLKSRPFSISEQFAFRRFIKQNDFFWATSLSHPLFSRNVLAIVHDVAQIDLPAKGLTEHVKKCLFWIFLRSIAKSSACLLFNSKFTQDRFNAKFSVKYKLQGVTLLASGIPNPDWHQLNFNKENYFIVLGNIRPHKNLPFLIEAFLSSGELKGFRLKIIGSQSPENLNLISKSWDQKRIQAVGYLEEEMLAKELMAARALLFPSLYEGFGLPALEAMAHGCPVIAANNSSLPEVCGNLGFYFDPKDSLSFLSAVSLFFKLEGDSLKSHIEECHRRAMNFSWARCSEETFHIIERVLV